MAGRFDAFVLFAEMRTGSNYLEASLDALPDLACYGEVYNPTFMGNHTTFEMFGYDMNRREADPIGLLDAMIEQTEGLPGFRLFHDHDDRVVDRVLPDPRIAKVILTRNPLESYVSRKIATATGQWRLKDVKQHRSAVVRYDQAEFVELIDRLQSFQARLQRGLQTTGQTAFYVRYEDINDPEVLNGLAAFLGSDHQVEAASKKLIKQNPSDLSEKVENYDEMRRSLSRLDRFDLNQTPNFEPPRHAGVPGFYAHPETGLLFMPIKGAPETAVLDWMGQTGGVGREALITGMTQKDLRKWIKTHPGYRSFTVLRHPLARAYEVFNRYLVPTDQPGYRDPRHAMQKRYDIPFPKAGEGLDATAMRQAFLAFLTFLKGNLAGQTSVRVDQAWATQTAILQGAASFALPHRMIHEADAEDMLPLLAAEVGVDAPTPGTEPPASEIALADIYDDRIEKAAMDVYRRDYLTFGFKAWNQS